MIDRLLTTDDVLNILFVEVGDTGNAKIQEGGLFVQFEEQSPWMLHGMVEDPADAAGVIHDFFG